MPASNAKASAPSSTSDREIAITRVFDAPREIVFNVWTDPEHIGSWWGPKGFTTTIHEMDVRPGGAWRFIMHGPDGVDYRNENIYVEIARPERLVFEHMSGPRFQMTVTFEAQGERTKLTMRMVFRTAEERDHTVKTFNAIEGGNQTLDRLGERLRSMGNAGGSAGPDLRIVRTFDAPRASVFEAWTDAERLKQWWGPKGFTNPVCEFDARPGGKIRIHMRGPDGTVYPMTGVVREIAPPEKLVFTSAALDENGVPLFEILNSVSFAESGGKTTLTLEAKVIMRTAAAPRFLAGMEQGWSQSLDRLAEFARG